VPLDSQESGEAVLQSEPINYTPDVCLKFFYHIKAANNVYSPKLLVMVSTPSQTEPIVKAIIRSQYVAQWTQFNLTLNNMPPLYRFMLKTVEGNLSISDVAVDDIQIFNGACDKPFVPTTQTPLKTTQPSVIEHQWDCNFETDNCKWTLGPNWNRTWWIEGLIICYSYLK